MAKNEAMKMEPIQLEAARLLASSQAITVAVIEKTGRKWVLWFEGKKQGYVLKTARGEPRMFSTIEAAARTVREIGLGSVFVRLDNWNDAQGEI